VTRYLVDFCLEHTTNAHTILAEKQSGKSDMQYWGCLPHNWDEMT